MNRSNPPRPKCPVCRARKLPTLLLCSTCYRAFERIKAAPGESAMERLCRLADWAIRRAWRLERKAGNAAISIGITRGRSAFKKARHALAESLLGIESTTVEEYRSRAHALAMNWKLEE